MDKDTSFQEALEKESYTVVLSGYRWRFRRDLGLEVGRNISGNQGGRLRPGVERMGPWRVDRRSLERLAPCSLADRWPLR